MRQEGRSGWRPTHDTLAATSFRRVRQGERICVLAGRLRCLRGRPCPPAICIPLGRWRPGVFPESALAGGADGAAGVIVTFGAA